MPFPTPIARLLDVRQARTHAAIDELEDRLLDQRDMMREAFAGIRADLAQPDSGLDALRSGIVELDASIDRAIEQRPPAGPPLL